MDDESGFFNRHNRAASAPEDDGFHDFRLLYSSTKGFSRIFTAKKNGRIFIVKCLRVEYREDSTALSALRKEYDCGYPMDSPFVVKTYDFVNLDVYGPSIILEFCSGKPLSEMLEKGLLLDAADADSIVRSLISGLGQIHAHGIIHRDIKPSNLIYSGTTRSLKIIDFGCADADEFYLLHGAAGTERYTPININVSSMKTN